MNSGNRARNLILPSTTRQVIRWTPSLLAHNFIDFRRNAVLPITSALSLATSGHSTVTNKRVDVTLESQLDSVSLAEEMCTRIAAAAGFDDDDCFKIGMSVREGVINAYNYGSQKQPGKKIFLTFELTPEKLIVRVQDEGKGFRLEDVPDPLADENLLKSSGRGIFLMRSFMDEFDVQKIESGGAVIVMAKRLRTAPADTSKTA
jgi:serine/threonine-protein kinase RsbW